MADITLSPVPYNGGSFNTNQYTNATCMLSSGVFLHVVAQQSPAYVYAYVTTMTNARPGGVYSTVASPMRAICSAGTTPAAPASLTGLRLFKLNATTAAMVLEGSMYVLQVGANNDVTVRAGSSLTLNLPQARPTYQVEGTAAIYTNNSSIMVGGSAWQFFYARDNVLYGLVRAASTSSENGTNYFMRIVYDPSTGTLTRNNMNNHIAYSVSVNPNQTTGFVQSQAAAGRAHLQDIPGSTTKLIQNRLNLNTNVPGFNSGYVVSAYLVTNTDGFSLIPQPPAGTKMLLALATNRILGFIDNKSYYVYNGTAWSTTPVVFSVNGQSTSASSILFEGMALDSNYFVIWTLATAANTDPGFGSSNTPTMYTRIGRFVDAGLGQVSTATASGDGLPMGSWTYPVWDQQPMVRDGTDAIFWYTRDNNTARPSIKVQYQAGG